MIHSDLTYLEFHVKRNRMLLTFLILTFSWHSFTFILIHSHSFSFILLTFLIPVICRITLASEVLDGQTCQVVFQSLGNRWLNWQRLESLRVGGGGEGVGRGLRFGLIPSPDKCSPCFLKFSQFIYFLWSWKSLVGFIRLLVNSSYHRISF